MNYKKMEIVKEGGKIMSKQKTFNFILYLLLSILSLTLTILLLIPYTRTTLISILFAIVIFIYLVFFLIRRVIKEKKLSVVIIDVIEIVLVSVLLIAIFIPNISFTNNMQQIFGLLIWIRGTTNILTQHFSLTNYRHKIISTIVDVAFITVGSVLIIMTSYGTIQTILTYILSVLMILTLIYGVSMIIKSINSPKNL